jgi:outer membrane immunogenic protein
MLRSGLLALLVLPVAAHAADFIRPAGPVLFPSPWSGAYAGLIGGVGMARASDLGWIGGINAGYNFVAAPRIVTGIEADVVHSDKSGAAGTLTVSNNWNATLRVRAGYASPDAMIYAAGGLALGWFDGTTTTNAAHATRVGATLALGVEATINSNKTIRAEYRYTNFGSPTLLGHAVPYSSNDFLAGADLKFW